MSSFRRRRVEPSDTDEIVRIVRPLGERFIGRSEYTARTTLTETLIREREGAAWVSRLVTVRAWRRRRDVVLGADATSNTGAHRLYECAGMHVDWSPVVCEKELQ